MTGLGWLGTDLECLFEPVLLVEEERLLQPEQDPARLSVLLSDPVPLSEVLLVVVEDAIRERANVLLGAEPDARHLARRGHVGRRLGEGRAESLVEDGDDGIVVLGEVIEDDGVRQTLLGRRSRRRNLDDPEQVRPLIWDVSKLDVSLNCSGLSERLSGEGERSAKGASRGETTEIRRTTLVPSVLMVPRSSANAPLSSTRSRIISWHVSTCSRPVGRGTSAERQMR